MSSSNFIKFASLLRARYESFGNVPLFRTAVDGDTLWQLYLASFPPGTNELFRKRAEREQLVELLADKKKSDLLGLSAAELERRIAALS